jgi:hypothetical protein
LFDEQADHALNTLTPAEKALFDAQSKPIDDSHATAQLPSWFEHNAPPSVLARNYLRQAIGEMTDTELAQLRADLWAAWQDVIKLIEARSGHPFWKTAAELLAEEFTDHVANPDGVIGSFVDFDGLQAFAARVPSEYGGDRLRHSLERMFPGRMDWMAKEPEFQTEERRLWLSRSVIQVM